ncbi:MAG: chromosome segregation protein SMC [Ekhidna sp.]|nr:chromosome segregation protein SMC [Ekhidna sp.]
MQLTKLEIKGFKSFADRVVINFDDGITGIVGPNGCGKSNVVDSIRWVLGEQKSRVLRSDKMENVIFNGTKARKPIQLVEVSLTFNNTKNLIPTEYSQVTITRRYYRSGESEYLLNGVACRLKDITNLFLDTGIASNSYAIIELKMVDDLLNDRDNSRRSLFEEAAGISKFKIRKKETLKKLDDTDADLERVKDLLFEIEKNLKSLERQANQAKKYYEIKEKYKYLSISLAKKLITNQESHFNVIWRNIQEENDKKLALNTLVLEKESSIEQAKSDLIMKEKLLSSRQKTLNEHISKIRQYEGDKKIKDERQKFLRDKIENLKELIDHDKQSQEQAALSLEGLRNGAREVEKEVVKVLTEVEKFKEEYENQKAITTKSQDQLNKLNTLFSEKREQHFQLKKELEIKEIQLHSMSSELNKIREDSSQQSASLKEFRAKLEKIEEEKQLKKSAFETLKNNENELKSSIEKEENKLSLQKERLAVLNRKLDAKQNEFDLTKSHVDNLKGFPDAIKFLKKQKEWKDTPLLSDIISCPEEYRVAVENFLEPYMNYYVAETEKNAIQAVNLLSNSSQGKANFFILEKLDAYRKPETNPSVVWGIPAMDIVDYDKRFENLISYLMGSVFISENPGRSASEDAIVILDKEGKITYRQFMISGGSTGLFEGKRIGGTKNLERLEKEIKELKEQQRFHNNAIETLKTRLEQLKQSSKHRLLEETKEDISRINEFYVLTQTKREQFSELLSSNKTRKVDIQLRIEALNNSIESITPQLEELNEKLIDVEEKLDQNRSESSLLQEQLEIKSSNYNEQNVIFHRKQNKLDSILQEISYKEESYENTVKRIEGNGEDLASATSNLNELIKKTTENDDEIAGMYEEKESLESGVGEVEREYYEARSLIDKEEKHLRETQRQRERVDHALMEWQSKLNEARIGLNSIKDRLSVEFNIDPEKISESDIEDYKKYSEEDLKNKVEKLKNKINSIGPINPMAMEAFKEIKERHAFISEQKEDLLKAKESLLTTIGEINEVAKETFMNAFKEIKNNFIKVFRTLFTEEDDCDLILTNPEQPLESDINIIAKPKGKRPLTINQLSGGEKTLTATALLFSIYLIKPAPFCIFDEVDAPLDDANIDKFNEIIRKFSQESQFIIVTHNKRTMTGTDVIYGVTMQEQGVSKVVPVDLRELA